MAKVFVCNAADIYKEVTEKLSRVEAKPKAKAYRNLNSMLQECYFVGATKFGNNFIAQSPTVGEGLCRRQSNKKDVSNTQVAPLRVEVPATIHSKHEDKERKSRKKGQKRKKREKNVKKTRRRELTVIKLKFFGTRYKFLLNIGSRQFTHLTNVSFRHTILI